MSAERVQSQIGDNTSGQGKGAVLPDELDRLNWAAFFLSWIWGLGNKTYIALLALLPLFNVVMPFVLLFKGNKWAWANKSWDDVDHFRRVQRKWGFATLILYTLFIVGGGAAFYYGNEAIKKSDAYVMSLNQVRQHPESLKTLGQPIDTGWMVSGNFEVSGPSGNADFSYNVNGPKDAGKVYVSAIMKAGQWRLTELILEPQNGSRQMLLKGAMPTAQAMPEDAAPKMPAAEKKATPKPPEAKQKGAPKKEPEPAKPEKAETPKERAPDLAALRLALEKGDAEAPQKIRDLASKGNKEALVLLGDLHILGKGVFKNASLAFGLYQRAAEAGYAIAQYRTGTLYQEGIGTALDMKKAREWLSRAAVQGYPQAREALTKLGVTPPPVEMDKKKTEKK